MTKPVCDCKKSIEKQAYIAIGSNLNNPKKQVISAVNHINTHHAMQVIKVSRWYESAPVGPTQPNYINGVVQISTTLCPLHLLDALQDIENTHGRVRKEHWGARTLDLDIALYSHRIIKCERLHIPHPFIKERNFVIMPLLDITPTLLLPCNESVQALANQLGSNGITPIHV